MHKVISRAEMISLLIYKQKVNVVILIVNIYILMQKHKTSVEIKPTNVWNFCL